MDPSICLIVRFLRESKPHQLNPAIAPGFLLSESRKFPLAANQTQQQPASAGFLLGTKMPHQTSSTVIKVAGHEVVIRELTVNDVRGLIDTDPAFDLVGDTLLEDIRLRDMPVFTNLTEEQIGEMYPSDLKSVQEACKAKNPDFFGMVARVIKPRVNP